MKFGYKKILILAFDFILEKQLEDNAQEYLYWNLLADLQNTWFLS